MWLRPLPKIKSKRIRKIFYELWLLRKHRLFIQKDKEVSAEWFKGRNRTDQQLNERPSGKTLSKRLLLMNTSCKSTTVILLSYCYWRECPNLIMKASPSVRRHSLPGRESAIAFSPFQRALFARISSGFLRSVPCKSLPVICPCFAFGRQFWVSRNLFILGEALMHLELFFHRYSRLKWFAFETVSRV